MFTKLRGPPGRPQTVFFYFNHNSIYLAITLNTYTEILPIRRKMRSHQSMISNSLVKIMSDFYFYRSLC